MSLRSSHPVLECKEWGVNMLPTSNFHDLRKTQSEMDARKLYLGTFKETN